MSGPEIKRQIEENMKIIEEEATLGQFILSPRAQAAIKNCQELMSICQHTFNDNKQCIYCNYEVEE